MQTKVSVAELLPGSDTVVYVSPRAASTYRAIF
jgi:hypothetical protein